MNVMKYVATLIALILMTGCVSRAQIDMPTLQPVQAQAYQGKVFYPDLYYSQPDGSLFSGAPQEALRPIGSVSLSHACSPAMTNFDQLLSEQLPTSSRITHDARASDYRLKVEIVAHEHRGPVYLDYLMDKNLPMNLLTFGVANEDFDVIANFNIVYRLYNEQQQLVFHKDYAVKDSVPHQAGNFDVGNLLILPAQDMMKKYLLLTMNDFLTHASQRPLPQPTQHSNAGILLPAALTSSAYPLMNTVPTS